MKAVVERAMEEKSSSAVNRILIRTGYSKFRFDCYVTFYFDNL
jgi:hypothetical protein